MVDCRCRLSKEGAWALAQSGNVADKRSGEKRQQTRSSNAGQGWEDANLHSARGKGARGNAYMQIHYFTLPQPMGIVPICLIASTVHHLLPCLLISCLKN